MLRIVSLVGPFQLQRSLLPYVVVSRDPISRHLIRRRMKEGADFIHGNLFIGLAAREFVPEPSSPAWVQRLCRITTALQNTRLHEFPLTGPGHRSDGASHPTEESGCKG